MEEHELPAGWSWDESGHRATASLPTAIGAVQVSVFMGVDNEPIVEATTSTPGWTEAALSEQERVEFAALRAQAREQVAPAVRRRHGP